MHLFLFLLFARKEFSEPVISLSVRALQQPKDFFLAFIGERRRCNSYSSLLKEMRIASSSFSLSSSRLDEKPPLQINPREPLLVSFFSISLSFLLPPSHFSIQTINHTRPPLLLLPASLLPSLQCTKASQFQRGGSLVRSSTVLGCTGSASLSLFSSLSRFFELSELKMSPSYLPLLLVLLPQPKQTEIVVVAIAAGPPK